MSACGKYKWHLWVAWYIWIKEINQRIKSKLWENKALSLNSPIYQPLLGFSSVIRHSLSDWKYNYLLDRFLRLFFFNQAMTCIYEAGISNSVSYLSSYTATDKSKSKRWHLMTAEYTCISPFDIYIKKTWELNEKKKLDIWKYINSYLHLITIHGLSFSREKN